MSIANYTDLVAACQNWLFGRTDITARIPEFIALFEAVANRTLFCRQMELRAFTNCEPASSTPEWLTLPFDFQTLRRVRIVNVSSGAVAGPTPRLRFATQAQIDDLRATYRSRPTGPPIWFALFGTEMEMVPTPDLPYQLEIIYRAYVPPLGAVNSTNWLLAAFPDAYLYGTLTEASPYIYDDERTGLWQPRTQSAIAGINALNDHALYNSGPLVRRNSNRQGYS